MRELVGQCASCGKDIYCVSGFFEGESIEGHLYCHQCATENKE